MEAPNPYNPALPPHLFNNPIKVTYKTNPQRYNTEPINRFLSFLMMVSYSTSNINLTALTIFSLLKLFILAFQNQCTDTRNSL